MSNKEVMAVNAIRVLAADSIQKANSGHPGLPLGCAPMAYELWAKHMKHNPANPDWFNRDRFIRNNIVIGKILVITYKDILKLFS